MRVRSRSTRRGKRSSPWLYLVGVFGVGCVAWAAVGLWHGALVDAPVAPPRSMPTAHPASAAVQPVAALAEEQRRYYPMDVGRYWVYRNEDPVSGAAVRQERRIARRERRDDQELFFYDDGGMAYWQGDKVYEIGAQGSLNVIPLGPRAAGPYAYRTQDMYVEKQVGAPDTTVVVEGRRYEGCLEVVTRLQLADQDPQSARTYSSYYARGIGLVGQEWWPRERITVALEEYGVE